LLFDVDTRKGVGLACTGGIVPRRLCGAPKPVSVCPERRRSPQPLSFQAGSTREPGVVRG
jgi:hypothetical protein